MKSDIEIPVFILIINTEAELLLFIDDREFGHTRSPQWHNKYHHCWHGLIFDLLSVDPQYFYTAFIVLKVSHNFYFI